MPRNGSNVYSAPAGTLATTLTTIKSPEYNAFVNDLVTDANTARPVVAGGTGATTAVAAGDAFSTKGADIASAATTDIGAATGRYVHITGTTTITALGTKTAGVVRILTFDGALTLTHNGTSLILPNAASILTAAGDVAVFVSEGSGNWRCVSYTRASGASSRASPGHLYGLTIANNATDATNDIDIAAGEAASDAASPVLITLSSALTKRLDAAWAVGTGNGGLDTGSIANTTYHMWLIQRSDTGVVDVLFSASATAPTMPTNYDRKRRIGSIIRASAAILPFIQHEDTFWHNNATTGGIVDLNAAASTGTVAVTRTLTVPLGLAFDTLINLHVRNTSGANCMTMASALELPDVAPGNTVLSNGLNLSTFATDPAMITQGSVRTNTSGQIRTRASASGVNILQSIATLGWTDKRGRQ